MKPPKRANHRLPAHREAAILHILTSGEKYGLEIRQEYERATAERMPLGSLYTTLDRMVAKRFIRSRYGASQHARGGNQRKYYHLLGVGADALSRYTDRLRTVPALTT